MGNGDWGRCGEKRTGGLDVMVGVRENEDGEEVKMKEEREQDEKR